MQTVREETEDFLNSSDDYLCQKMGEDVVDYLFKRLTSLETHEWELTPDQGATLNRELILVVAEFLDREGLHADAIVKQANQVKEEISEAGRQAYKHGVGRNQAPHPSHTPEYKWWISGYEKAEAEEDDVE